MKIMQRFFLGLMLLAGGLCASRAYAAQNNPPQVLALTASGALNPAMKDYLQRGIRQAEAQGAAALVFQIDTPGGEIGLMTEMVEVIRASRVPVIVYVAPRGAMAGSAGTLITLAGHLAAMAPETTIGAASPVGPGGEDLGETMQAKTKNILKATVRSLAERRGPQAVRLAEATIENASAVSAPEALQSGLVDFIAVDLNDLLRQCDDHSVQMTPGQTMTLHLAQAEIQTLSYSILEQLLAVLTSSVVVFLLLIVGVQAILIEISSPGGWVAGAIGVVCLALAGYGLGVLPVNWFGIVFLVLAFVLFLLDINAPTHGALTAAGVGALIVSGMVLFNSPGAPSFQRVPVPLIVGVSLSTGLIFFALMLWAVRTFNVPVRTGVEGRVGRIGAARSDLLPGRPRGLVHLDGEQWSAELAPGEEAVPNGAPVEVVAVQGLKLIVRRQQQQSQDADLADRSQ